MSWNSEFSTATCGSERERVCVELRILHNSCTKCRYTQIVENSAKGDKTMWANESVFYQIYPLGFCGAPVK